MATASTKPSWVDETDDPLQVEDPEMVAMIEAAMKERGVDPPENGWRAEGDASAPSVNATDPGNQSVGAEDGTAGTVADAPSAVEGVGDAAVGVPGTGTTTIEDEQVPESFKVLLPSGDTWDATQEQINYLLSVNSWLESQPQTVKQQWKGIEDGTHQAIPNPDYQAYQAWVAAGRPSAQQTAATPTLRPDLSLLDDSTAAYIESLEGRVSKTQVPATTQAPDPTVTPTSELDIQARITREAQAEANRQIANQGAVQAAVADVTARYNLDANQVAHLTRVTTNLNVVPGIVERKRQYSHTGTMIAEAPMRQVFDEAFEVAMATDPELRTIRDDIVYQQRLANNGKTLSTVAAKRANAGSLATAPSAAVPGREIDPRKMTPQQRHDAMVEELGGEMGLR